MLQPPPAATDPTCVVVAILAGTRRAAPIAKSRDNTPTLFCIYEPFRVCRAAMAGMKEQTL